MKTRAVRLYRESDPKPTIRKPAEQLGVHHEALRNWIRQTEADAGKRLERVNEICVLRVRISPRSSARPGGDHAVRRTEQPAPGRAPATGPGHHVLDHDQRWGRSISAARKADAASRIADELSWNAAYHRPACEHFSNVCRDSFGPWLVARAAARPSRSSTREPEMNRIALSAWTIPPGAFVTRGSPALIDMGGARLLL
ncbi:hypothetical protein C5E45_03605 [Nocardia nova]|uniref:Transposase n=1 Tax=Nocardia nova TaxID=37330 RepID=A0A2S6AVQ6_9NOCA|nr:hypothetical protein C5E41_02525 [Nocardia nova]PPJ39273.1 hypothetical protein C5E45_03605 [Nocardia nova]